MSRTALSLLTVVVVLSCGPVLFASVTTDLAEERMLIASNVWPSDQFGNAVAIDGDTAVIGAYSHGPPSDSGIAYVFEKTPTGWSEVAILTASNPGAGDWFGWSVGISGDTVVVGAPAGDTTTVANAGTAYVFERPAGGWMNMTETAMLTASDAILAHGLGNAVAISGDTIVVADESNQIFGFLSGAAYVFERPAGGWSDMTETAKLWASNGSGSDRFGNDVSISGDTIAVGSRLDNTPFGSTTGSVFVFDRPLSGWASSTEDHWLFSPTLQQTDQFGSSVSIDGDTLAIGAEGANDGCPGVSGCSSGAAYIFVRNGQQWSEQARLLADDPKNQAFFGRQLDVCGDRVAVGSPGNAYSSVIVFDRSGTTWSRTKRLTSANAHGYDTFGGSVELDGEHVLCGADHYDGGGYNLAGAAFMFSPDSNQWTDLGNGLAGVNGVPTLEGDATLLDESVFRLDVTGAAPSAIAAWIVGASALNAPFEGGVLVPSLDIVVIFPTNGNGEAMLAGTWPAAVPTGVTLWFQTWIADAAAPQGAAATNGLSITSP